MLLVLLIIGTAFHFLITIKYSKVEVNRNHPQQSRKLGLICCSFGNVSDYTSKKVWVWVWVWGHFLPSHSIYTLTLPPVVRLRRNDPVTLFLSCKNKKCEFEFGCEDIFFLHTQSPHSHCPPWGASGAMILEESNSSKIKKCEFEFECEDIFFLHTQSTPSHCPPWCASGAMILWQSQVKKSVSVSVSLRTFSSFTLPLTLTL